ncbi:MAG: protein-export chaperone SecB [Legionellales bacterium]|nr:protein-export chaperone SecB [Legionellales bacterium]
MADDSQVRPVFQIQRIYVKDLSFEAPNTPKTFREPWKPEVKVDIDTKNEAVENDIHEVVLKVTVSVSLGDSKAFIVEAHQAGLFTLKDFPEDARDHALGSMCPNILYPYARETVSDAVSRGGFPQLLLAPVNFEALYMQKKGAQRAKKDAEKAGK